MSELTQPEREALRLLAEAYNLYVALPEQHPMHQAEFVQAVHAAQRLVMSRPVARAEGWVKPACILEGDALSCDPRLGVTLPEHWGEYGTGPITPDFCDHCRGTGFVPEMRIDEYRHVQPCPKCHGTGSQAPSVDNPPSGVKIGEGD